MVEAIPEAETRHAGSSENSLTRDTADFKIQKHGSSLLKAVHKRDGVATSLGSVPLSYPTEYLRSSMPRGGSDQAGPHRSATPHVFDCLADKHGCDN